MAKRELTGLRHEGVKKIYIKEGVSKPSLFNKITLATAICDRGDFHILGVLTHPLLHVSVCCRKSYGHYLSEV